MSEIKEVYKSVREKPWKDLQDNSHVYKKGDIYPREGLKVDKKRIKELASTKNKIGEILIALEQVKDEGQEPEIENSQVEETEIVEEEINESEDVKNEENTKIEESETTDKNEEE